MAAQFRSYVWDPALIVAQMVLLQAGYYSSLGLWLALLGTLGSTGPSLQQVFSDERLLDEIVYKFMPVLNIKISFSCRYVIQKQNALGLLYFIRRGKQCLDFTITVHFFHLLGCWIYNSRFPSTLTWWLVHIVCTALMAAIGEYLCMRIELREIPLNSAPKSNV
ncbi:Protein SYS1 like protein [Turdus rufiventris]|nr:Protein SYS1 like protein [Turdus rufiventris]